MFRRPPQVILITDCGPDPDDIKALVVAATLHARGKVALRAVVSNGGGQPVERAKLARCTLDHIGAHDVPVGYGSEGTPYSAQPHEYSLAGFDEPSTRARVQHGGALLLSALRMAPKQSICLVCISSLRDAADVCRTHEALVLRKVREVAVQGGLERAPDGRGWVPDSSVNNTFDMEAAAELYAFCFRHGLPLAVVSRNAVPLLPMQLANSFADRTECPVMRYLADAQSLGLEGLWLKLCEGKLPARCSKQWYFETFCGVDVQEFDRLGFDALDASAPIRAKLNGFVKPYDVVALMTVLPSTRGLFGAGQPAGPHVPFAERHRLLLSAADMVDVSHVLKLLRDTYHGVVLVTRASAKVREPRPAELRTALSDTEDMGARRRSTRRPLRSEASTGADTSHERALLGPFIRSSARTSDVRSATTSVGEASLPFQQPPEMREPGAERLALPGASQSDWACSSCSADHAARSCSPLAEQGGEMSTRAARPSKVPNAALVRLAANETVPVASHTRPASAMLPLGAGAQPRPGSALPLPMRRAPLAAGGAKAHEASGAWPASMHSTSNSGSSLGFFGRARDVSTAGASADSGVLDELDIVLLLERAQRQALARRNVAARVSAVVGSTLIAAAVLAGVVTVALGVTSVDGMPRACGDGRHSSARCALLALAVDPAGITSGLWAALQSGVLVTLLGLMPVRAMRERIFAVGGAFALLYATTVAACIGALALTTTEAGARAPPLGVHLIVHLAGIGGAATPSAALVLSALRYRLHSAAVSLYDGGEAHALWLLWLSAAVLASATAALRVAQLAGATSDTAATRAARSIHLALCAGTVAFALLPSARLGVQARLSWLASGRGAHAPLAVLSGFGTMDERDPAALVREALLCFVPVQLTERALRALSFDNRMEAHGTERRTSGSGLIRLLLGRNSYGRDRTSSVRGTHEAPTMSVCSALEGVTSDSNAAESCRESFVTQDPLSRSGRPSDRAACIGAGADGTPLDGAAADVLCASPPPPRMRPPFTEPSKRLRKPSAAPCAQEAPPRVREPRTSLRAVGSPSIGGGVSLRASKLALQQMQAPAATLQLGHGAARSGEQLAAAHADAYVVHSWADSAADKTRVLSAWAREWRRAHGRAPVVWIDAMCADPLLRQREVLQHVTVYMARCRRLLLLCGPTLMERLWCVAECYAWRASGGQLTRVDVLLVAPNGQTVVERTAEWQAIIGAVDAFHVMWADAWDAQVRARISAAVVLATVSGVNEVIRDFLPVIQRAAKVDLDASRGADAQADSNGGMEPSRADDAADDADALPSPTAAADGAGGQAAGPSTQSEAHAAPSRTRSGAGTTAGTIIASIGGALRGVGGAGGRSRKVSKVNPAAASSGGASGRISLRPGREGT